MPVHCYMSAIQTASKERQLKTTFSLQSCLSYFAKRHNSCIIPVNIPTRLLSLHSARIIFFLNRVTSLYSWTLVALYKQTYMQEMKILLRKQNVRCLNAIRGVPKFDFDLIVFENLSTCIYINNPSQPSHLPWHLNVSVINTYQLSTVQ